MTKNRHAKNHRLVTRTRIVTVNRYIHTMIGDLFIALCRVPLLKKKLWRAWYNYLARAIRAPDWCFMNYGFADRESSYLQLEPGDEQDRYCIQLYRHVAGAVDLTRRNVLEVGSGRGGGASFVKRYLNPARVTGVDLSESAVDFSMSRHRVEGLHFRVGDAEHLPFDNESFDVVINVESSHCYPRLSSFFFEVRRVLKLGGHFLYADLHDAKTLGEWRACLRGSGLAILAETNITSNVVTALDRDNQRKVTLIQRLVPSLLRPSFQNFAGVRGSQIHEAFQSGPLEYLSFVAQKQI